MKRLIIAVAVLAAVVAFFLLLPEPRAPQPDAWPVQSANGFMLRSVRVFDGEQLHGARDVLVVDGVIAQVNPRLPLPDGVVELAADGHTLLPAFFDAHTHNFLTSRVDALRFGVGTQIDMFSDHHRLQSARLQRESVERTDEADMWSAGTLITAAGGHGTQFGMTIPTLDDAAGAEAFIAERVSEGSDFVKLVLEPGHVIGREMPTLSAEALTAAIAATHAHEKLAVVHVTTRADAATAIAAGADALVHLFGDEVIDAALVAAMRERGVFVIPTLAILESVSGRVSGLTEDARIAPYLTPAQRDSLERPFPGNDGRAAMIERAQASVRALHAAGVPVLAGSDAPNPGAAHGASLHRELELLVQAGMTPAEALAAATSAVADRFGIAGRGRIARGQRADLVLVDGSPLEDITVTRDIIAIWKNGYRIERPRFDGQVSGIPPLEDPVLGAFDAGEDRWAPTTDRIQGGQSDAEQRVTDGTLVVSGEVRSGSAWPWAGTIRMFGTQPFEPVDASAYSKLVLRVRGDGGKFNVLFFAGEGGQAPPLTWPFDSSTDWQELEIPLAEVSGLDLGRLRAIALVAGPEARAMRFELDTMVLR